MAEVRIKCPRCGEILSADDKYLRYTVGCGVCHSTFIFDSICIEGNQGTIPVFPSAGDTQLAESEKKHDQDCFVLYESLRGIKVGKIAKAVFFYALQNNLCSQKELSDLSSEEKCRDFFHFGYPLLVALPVNNIDKSKLLIKGYCRYYRDPVQIGENVYFVCSQWYDYNRAPMLAWAYRHKITPEIIESYITNDSDELEQNQPEISRISSDGRKKGQATFSENKNASFFKAFNKSVFVVGITIPNDLRSAFLKKISIDNLECGIGHAVKIMLDEKSFDAHLLKANQKNGCYFWRLQWSKSSPIAIYLQKKFPNIYQAFEQQDTPKIPEDYGIIVSETAEMDVFSMICVGEDIPALQINPRHVQETHDESDDMHESTSGSAFFAFQLDKRPQTLTHTKPKSITINGEYFAVSTWKNILMVVYKYLNRVSSEDLLILSDESNVFKTTSRICVGSDPQKLKSPVKIDSTLWIESNFSANNIVDLSAELFTFFGIQLSKVTIEITATANTGENSELAPVSEEISSGNAAFDDALEQWGKDNL